MARIIFLIICLILALGGSSASTNIECKYRVNSYSYPTLGFIYLCYVGNHPNIYSEDSAQISGVSGGHDGYKNNDNVNGFHAELKTMQFFPKGLEKFFKNIKMIDLYFCKLKELHQSDLKAFPDLIYFRLGGNGIEVIEAGLFDFNPNLEFIGFWESSIIHIDPNVFDNLNKLSYFKFFTVPCVDQNINDSKEKVQEVLKVVRSNCSNSEYLSLENQIKSLEIVSKIINSEALSLKLENFEKNLKNSKLSTSQTLNYKFQNLKRTIKAIQIDQGQNTSTSDVNLSNDLKNITEKSEDLKASHFCPVDDLKASQNELQSTLSDIKLLVTDHGSKLDQVQNSCMIYTLSNCDPNFDSLEASNDKILKIITDIDAKFDQKLEMFEENLMNLENESKIEEIKKELGVLSKSMDLKLKAAENRLMEKMERILKALYIF